MWITLCSSTSNNENVKPNNNNKFFFRNAHEKPRGASKSTTQNEPQQTDFIKQSRMNVLNTLSPSPPPPLKCLSA